MSSVVEFELRMRGPRTELADGASAEIIIFPGVRFERLDTLVSAPELPTAPVQGAGLNGTRMNGTRAIK